MIQKGFSGFKRFLAVMETEPEIQDSPDAKPLKDVRGLVSFEDVSFHYSDDDTLVLSNVSFQIPAGKSIALAGPSGSGKTTICSLLPRFYDVSSGRITIDGKDIRDLTLESLRNQIGIVQQDVYLFCGTIKENIAYGKPNASMDEIVDAARKANIHDFIESLPDGYDTFVGERGTRLSGGQKQRISIARVFLKNPPILILDEPPAHWTTKVNAGFSRVWKFSLKTEQPSRSHTDSPRSREQTRFLSLLTMESQSGGLTKN